MDVEDRLALIRQVGEEIVTEEELRALLAEKPHPIAYDGFEPSGTIHIAQGVLRAINVNKMTRAGVRFKMFVADWHAWANNKMGGDLAKIQTTGKYIVEIWKATGMDLDHVKFVWASEFVTDEAYWKKVMNIARDSSLDRILRTTQIMGRSEKDKLSAAQILYPCMQAADIFHLEADITQLGMDQRKVNMLAREVGPKYGYAKPVVVSHHMLMGLQAPPPVVATQREAIEYIREFVLQNLAASSWSVTLPPEGDAMYGAILRKLSESGHSFQHYRRLLTDAAKQAFEKEGKPQEIDEDPYPQLHNDLYLLFKHRNQPRPRNPAAEVVPSIVPSPTDRREHFDWGKLARRLLAWERGIAKFQSDFESEVVERATAMKMSKSNPDTAIFMTDTPEQVTKKLNKAFCPEKVVDENPVMEYYRYIIFERSWANHRTAGQPSPVTIERPEKFGGNATYDTYAALAADYAEGKIHPADLKKTAAKYINEILQPVREHFEKDEKAKALKAQVESFKVTR